MSKGLKPISELSRSHKTLLTLVNRVNVDSLIAAHRGQNPKKAPGVDKMTKQEYGEHLYANVMNLVGRMKTFTYVPLPVRRTYIPKDGGKFRPLGIPAYEDKLVQSVMADILIQVYEPRFLDCSYGFRPGRGCHDVVRKVNKALMWGPYKWVLEADIKGFFDNVNHEWLMTFLKHDIGDPNFLWYIERFLEAGVMEDTQW
ncbi:MAG: reverse transcriptase domain-containing protein, partial [Desulfovibrionaceae bacterium]|nr:reverse transcriptase domain-containing protein [Desulfovibrionaceae bacterium]